MCWWLFQIIFSSTKTNPQKKPAHLLPPFCFTHEKKWPGKRRIFQSTFTKPKGIVQPMVGVFFSIQKHITFGRNPSSSRGMWKNNAGFFGRYILRWLVGGYLLKRIWFNEKNPMEHLWTWMEWVEFRSYEIRKTCIQQCGIPIPIDNDNNPIDNNTIIRLWVYFRLNCHVLSTRISIQ